MVKFISALSVKYLCFYRNMDFSDYSEKISGKSLLIMFHILLCHIVWGAGLGLDSVSPSLGLGLGP